MSRTSRAPCELDFHRQETKNLLKITQEVYDRTNNR